MNHRRDAKRLTASLVLLPLLLVAGCTDKRDFAEAKALIATHCARCHTVPGVPQATGRIGPSLAGIASRPLIAGQFANNRPAMARWLTNPQHMLPGGRMPDIGLTRPQAMVVTDYLSTLD
jgi:cytochrome c2